MSELPKVFFDPQMEDELKAPLRRLSSSLERRREDGMSEQDAKEEWLQGEALLLAGEENDPKISNFCDAVVREIGPTVLLEDFVEMALLEGRIGKKLFSDYTKFLVFERRNRRLLSGHGFEDFANLIVGGEPEFDTVEFIESTEPVERGFEKEAIDELYREGFLGRHIPVVRKNVFLDPPSSNWEETEDPSQKSLRG